VDLNIAQKAQNIAVKDPTNAQEAAKCAKHRKNVVQSKVNLRRGTHSTSVMC